MNGKKAKALRRIARERTQGKPERAYFVVNGKKMKDGTIIGGNVVLPPNESTRGYYRALKKAYKRSA